ncbi:MULTISPECIES: HutP family protein [Thermaerobacter]|uniref:HutP protein n=1 Tax=Thermaerobacter subterraneus DSM 13965 TaxID=867903 RepID=K6QD90_9FIRM|nr:MULTISPECIES: HutP family protein [Thermaerobacter]EKP94606.1 HutP protein [Thermaerobacter subterraneus DSM 13965]QIA26282.1 hut operon positive regulator HutP [Thermaerobacter sp. PB12/4term]
MTQAEGPNLAVARAALRLATSATRSDEGRIKDELLRQGIRGVAVDFGGPYVESIGSMVQRAIVAARREGVIAPIHPHEGAVAGAAREALAQLAGRALGFNVGGKVAIARLGEHLACAVFVGVGLVHLDDVAVGLAHRAVPDVAPRSGPA